jgi:DNA-dependent RNA polymerase auxiliary subunit epsilon
MASSRSPVREGNDRLGFGQIETESRVRQKVRDSSIGIMRDMGN